MCYQQLPIEIIIFAEQNAMKNILLHTATEDHYLVRHFLSTKASWQKNRRKYRRKKRKVVGWGVEESLQEQVYIYRIVKRSVWYDVKVYMRKKKRV